MVLIPDASRPLRVLVLETLAHELTRPPLPSADHYSSTAIKEVPGRTALTIRHEMAFTSFRQRVRLPLGVRQSARWYGWQDCRTHQRGPC